MPLSVRLDAETEALIERLARRRRASKSDVVRAAIVVLARRESGGAQAGSPYAAIGHLIGCADSGGLALSEKSGAAFRKKLQESRGARRSR